MDLFDFLDMVMVDSLSTNNSSIFLEFAAKQIGFVLDEEIQEFALTCKTPEAIAQGYTDEDATEVKETLHRWRDKYCVRPKKAA